MFQWLDVGCGGRLIALGLQVDGERNVGRIEEEWNTWYCRHIRS